MSFKTDLRDAASSLAKDVLDALGDTISWTNKSNTAITLTADAGPMSIETKVELNVTQEENARSFLIPAQAGLLAYITTKQISSNVAIITTSPAHGFVVGQQVLIALDTADSVFDGYQIITVISSTTVFRFAKTNADVASASAAGYARAIMNVGDKITFESVPYEVRKVSIPDGIWAAYQVDCVRAQWQSIGGE